MARASESKLADLHDQVTDTLKIMTTIRTVTRVGKDGQGVEEEVEPSPATLAVAAKFLKDNSIFSAPEQSGAMDALKEQLDSRKNKRKLTVADLDRAGRDELGSIGAGLIQ